MKITQKHIIIGAAVLGIGYIFLRMRANRPIVPTSFDDFTRTFDLTPIPEPAPLPTVLPTPIPEQRNIFKQITDGIRDFIDPIIPDAILPPRVTKQPQPITDGLSGLLDRKRRVAEGAVQTIVEAPRRVVQGISGLVDTKRRVAEGVVRPITQGISGLVDTKRRVAEGAARTIVEAPRRVAERLIQPIVEAPRKVAEGISGLLDKKRRAAEGVVRPIVEAPKRIAEGIKGFIDKKKGIAKGVIGIPRKDAPAIRPALPLPSPPSSPKPTVMRTATPTTRATVLVEKLRRR